MEQQGPSPCIPSSATNRDTPSARGSPASLSAPTVTPQPLTTTTSTTPNSAPTTTTTTTASNSTSNLAPTTPTAGPTTSTSTPPLNQLSASEPSLRFPRPQGNRHLANWISSSDPDIMRVTTTEDTGLSESTYELITGTDTESQDDNYTESISESVGSLDFHRPDDVHSLADTEHTYDDESVAGDFEPHTNPASDDQDEEDDDTGLDQTPGVQYLGTFTPNNESDAECESEDDARSRSSLEYTQQSLKTPSIPTPEASKIVDRPAGMVDPMAAADEGKDKAAGLRTTLNKWFSDHYAGFRDREILAWDSLMESATSALPGIIFALVMALLIPVFFYSPPPSNPHIPAATSVVAPHTTTLALTTSQASSTLRALSTSTGTAALVPLEDTLPDEWLFGAKKPELAVFKQHGHFLVRMPSHVKETWLAKKCLTFSATRGDDTVPVTVSSVDEGMLIKFPYEESHGTVKVDITATCRPKIRQIFRITFDKGIMEGALEMTKHLAQDLTDFVPAAAQEAERCFEEAKRSLETASDNVLTVSDGLIKDLTTRFHNAHRSLSFIKAGVRERIMNVREEVSKSVGDVAEQVKQQLSNSRDVQDQAQLSLLDAQISAKLWWLKMTGTNDEHDQYRNKAKGFMAKKKADATEARKRRRYDSNDKAHVRSGLWNKVFHGPRCAHKLGRGKRGMQQCNFVV
ncbi:hypothetical protein AK830_g10733 [Neonectria ditissima]|uniref:Uncharacterized protein n=1 Tax=Neonectria ditissima TaxID=78410 RepID=A0A0P7AP82_9HYPO|nr:hypothetical protein AK830_g10733 [Neonectria ditissima]